MPAPNAAPSESSGGRVGAVSNSRRWSIVWLLFLASFINYIDRGTVSVALPLIAHDLHFGPATKGVLLSAFFWSYSLMQIPIGWAADRFNLRWLYAGAFFLWSLSQGLTGLAIGLFTLILFRILLGFGESIYLPGGTRVISLLFAPQDRGLPSGLFDCGVRSGLAFGTPLTALLIRHYGWRHTFLLVGFTALLWLIPWLAVYPSSLGRRDSLARRPGQSPPASTPRRALSLDSNLLGICLGFFCFDYYWYVLITWLPDYLMTARHMELFRAGVYASLPYVVFAVGEPLGGWIADRLIRLGWNETRTRKGIMTVAFLTGLLLIPAALVHSPLQAIALIAGASLVGFGIANMLVITQSCAPQQQVGTWTGTMNFAGNLGGVLAPLATGFLLSRTGSYLPGFTLGALILVSGLFFYWFLVGELRPRASSLT